MGKQRKRPTQVQQDSASARNLALNTATALSGRNPSNQDIANFNYRYEQAAQGNRLNSPADDVFTQFGDHAGNQYYNDLSFKNKTIDKLMLQRSSQPQMKQNVYNQAANAVRTSLVPFYNRNNNNK